MITLHLKKKFFDKIVSGEKKLEDTEIKNCFYRLELELKK